MSFIFWKQVVSFHETIVFLYVNFNFGAIHPKMISYIEIGIMAMIIVMFAYVYCSSLMLSNFTEEKVKERTKGLLQEK